MYKEVFKFNARPFTSAPYVKHYFANESMSQTLTQARNCIDRSAGPVVVVGGPGSGKSLLLGMLEEQYQSQFSVANLTCVRLDKREDLLKSILFTLDQPHQGMSEGDLRFALIDYLKPSGRCPNGVLLLIDDAQTLGLGLLDEIRLITNFVRDGQARVRLVLCGSQMLEENLAAPKLQSLNQRIAARCYLTSMRREETARYIVEHINRVGGNGEQLFSADALKTIHEVSDGCPRLVNQVCEHALIVAATRGATEISENNVREAWGDVQGIPGDWSAPETSQQDASQIQNDDGWTVIEFGQLDDSDETEETGTVYDFENSEGEASSVDPETERHETVAQDDSESQPDPATYSEPAAESDSEPVAEAPAEHEDESPDQPQAEQAAPEQAEPEQTEPEQLEPEPVPDNVPPTIQTSVVERFITEPPVAKAPEESTTAAESPVTQFPVVKQHEPVAELDHPETSNDSVEDSFEPTPETTSETMSEPTVEEAAAPNGVRLQQPVETVDPFAESFDEEEHLLDRFAPVVAHQNHSSLEVTSEDLESLRPIEDPVGPGSPQLQLADQPEPVVEVTQQEQQSASLTAPTVQVIGLSPQPEPDAQSESVAQPPVAQQPSPEAPAAPEPEPDPVASADPEAAAESQPRQSNRDEVVENAEEIEREAEAILERLRLSTVSHETEQAEPTTTSTGHLTAEHQLRELDESQKVLEEILNQKSLLAAARTQPERPSVSGDAVVAQPAPEQSESINIEYPVAPAKPESEPRRDDSEMLIVSRMEQKMESPKNKEPEPIPFPETPVSKGRAQRMDYQQLFDQLRDISKEQI